jgi:hypothetical protein
MSYEFIFCIFACDTIDRYKNEIHKIEDTWGKTAISRSYKLLFFLGEEGPLTGENYIHLENVANDYLSAADKQYLGIKYTYDNFDFKYLYVCGTDTFVLIDNLTKYFLTSTIENDDLLLIGGHGDNRYICNKCVPFFSGGAGLILTKKTVQRIYPTLETLQSDWLDLCVANNYITYIPACDLSICYFCNLFGVRFIHVTNRFFNCNYLGYNNTPNGVYKCCTQSVDITTMIACHNMSANDFDNLYNILQDSNFCL